MLEPAKTPLYAFLIVENMNQLMPASVSIVSGYVRLVDRCRINVITPCACS